MLATALTGEPRPIDKFRIGNVARRLGTERIRELVADYEIGTLSGDLTAKYTLAKGTVLRLLEVRAFCVKGGVSLIPGLST